MRWEKAWNKKLILVESDLLATQWENGKDITILIWAERQLYGTERQPWVVHVSNSKLFLFTNEIVTGEGMEEKNLYWLNIGEPCRELVEGQEGLLMGHTNKKIMEIYKGWGTDRLMETIDRQIDHVESAQHIIEDEAEFWF